MARREGGRPLFFAPGFFGLCGRTGAHEIMDQSTPDHDVCTPAPRLARSVALWGGGAGLVAISIGMSRGVSGSSALGVASVLVAWLVGFVVLFAFKSRPVCRWALPVMLNQMMRTLLAPAVGLVVALLVDVDPFGFWLSLLAAAVAGLVGETVEISRMFRSTAGGGVEGGEVAA